MLNRVFANRYRLVEKLGIGGMAEVYKATDEVLGRTVAVKVMLPQYAGDATFAARFKQEAQSAANLQSPYIVNIYDWGYESSDGIYFIVMEYVRGTDLKTAIQQRGAISQRKAAEIGSQVCAALSVAHGYDIIHRDIKPHNIMVQPDGNAKVMDFGIARASGSSMTQTGSVLGTAYYVSPEQAQGKQLAPTTDLYSLGIVLYEATTGKVPFDAPDAVSVALKQVSEAPVPPSELNPNIDPELEAIILRAMEKNPANRYSTAEQMRLALNNYLAGRPIDAGIEHPAAQTRVMGGAALGADKVPAPVHTAVMSPVAGVQPALTVRSMSKARDEEKKRKRKNATIAGVIIGVLLLIAVGLLIFFLSSGGESKVEVPSVVSLSEEEAKAALKKVELEVGDVKKESSETVESGKVISSNPSAKTKVKKGTAVNLVVSSGPEAPKQVKVPNLRNKTPKEAEKELEALGLKYTYGGELYDPEVASGKICAQDPAADEMVNVGTGIMCHLSKGKETIPVPNVVNNNTSWQEATEILEREGFKVEYTDDEYSNDCKEGTVMKQSPAAGVTVEKGATITLTVSKGPAPVPMPDLTGKTSNEAISILVGLKLTPKFVDKETDKVSELDKVIGQDPSAGEPVFPGDEVIIYMGVKPKAP